MRDFQNAAGLFDAAWSRDELDGERQQARGGDKYSDGPGNIVARILCFTGAGGASFFYTANGATLFTGSMVIGDNTSTSAVIDFSDATLLAGTNVDDLFRLIELSDCAGVIDYAQRLFWWGERNKLNNWVNLGFDGGFTGSSLSALPAGVDAGFCVRARRD